MKYINFILSLVLLQCYVTGAYMRNIHTISNLKNEWENYKIKYNPTINEAEDHERYKIFVNNIKKIKKLNDQNSGTVYKMNKFGHMTTDEFMEYFNLYSKLIPKRESIEKVYRISGQNYSDIDWRKKGIVTPVKNQGGCGSCWAFSAVGQLESQYALLKNKTINLSEQQLVDCSKSFGNRGCAGGLMNHAFEYVKVMGINSQEDYPYKGIDMECRYNSSKSILYVKEIVGIPRADEKALSEAISINGPVSIAFTMTGNIQFYHSGVYSDKECEGKPINHGMLAVGLGSEPSLHYIIKNSWGTDFGINGYMLAAREQNNMCGIATFAIYTRIEPLN